MELITKAPKGTVDIVPGKSEKWQVMEDVFRSEAEQPVEHLLLNRKRGAAQPVEADLAEGGGPRQSGGEFPRQLHRVRRKPPRMKFQ